MEQYGITNGSVFVFTESGEEYIICDLITHTFDCERCISVALTDCQVVFRSVANINEHRPLHQQIMMPLSEFKSKAIVKPIDTRI
jgi:hypothetical protein